MNRQSIAVTAVTLAAIVTVIFSGCFGPAGPAPSSEKETLTPAVTTSLPSASTSNVVDSNNRFALDLYERLADDPEYGNGNILFSPFSISTALAITYEGARGRTADEIRSVFHFPDNRSILQSGYVDLIGRTGGQGNAYTLRTANALWAEQTRPFLPEYISTAGRYYAAKMTNLDFLHQPEEARITINQWVESQTDDRIKDLIPPGEIDSDTALVITNAIYFKGTWVKQFDPALTRDAEFLTGNGATVQVPMMQRTDDGAVFRYTETDSFQALELPYESGNGTGLSMLVILPRSPDPRGMTMVSDATTLDKIRHALTFKIVRVYLPKFTMETKYFLPRTLSAMGMPGSFTSGADFTGMDGARDLFITNVIHQAFIDVNEEGTEAAAATAVIMGKGAGPLEGEVPVFRADHPFIFIIQDNGTGNILFMGRVSNPAGS